MHHINILQHTLIVSPELCLAINFKLHKVHTEGRRRHRKENINIWRRHKRQANDRLRYKYKFILWWENVAIFMCFLVPILLLHFCVCFALLFLCKYIAALKVCVLHYTHTAQNVQWNPLQENSNKLCISFISAPKTTKFTAKLLCKVPKSTIVVVSLCGENYVSNCNNIR